MSVFYFFDEFSRWPRETLGPGQMSNLSQIKFVEPIYFEIGAWMVRRLLQLNSTQINWFDSSMGSTCQVG